MCDYATKWQSTLLPFSSVLCVYVCFQVHRQNEREIAVIKEAVFLCLYKLSLLQRALSGILI